MGLYQLLHQGLFRTVLLVGLLLSPWATAQPENKTQELAESQADLKRVSQAISSLKRKLRTLNKEQNQQINALKKSELDISDSTKNIRQLERNIQQIQNELETLQANSADRQADILHIKAQTKSLLTTLLKKSSTPDIAVILESSNPHEFSRLLSYSRILSEAQQRQTQAWLKKLEQLQKKQALLQKHKDRLANLKRQEQQEKQRLLVARKNRKAMLAEIKKDLKKGKRQLTTLEGNRKHLNKVVKEINRAIAEVERITRAPSLDYQKSKLPWPVKGRLKYRFGTRIENSNLRRNGVFIAARENSPVSAVQGGRVVFSDWLRGYGLVIILDHGNQYLTLYGHNHSLLHETGDWVRKGETIALTGTSGGSPESGLYFEVRKNGSPLDPVKWLKRK